MNNDSNRLSRWAPRPQQRIIRGGAEENDGILYNDIASAYQNALRWHIKGTSAHGDTACNVLIAWSTTLVSIDAGANRLGRRAVVSTNSDSAPLCAK